MVSSNSRHLAWALRAFPDWEKASSVAAKGHRKPSPDFRSLIQVALQVPSHHVLPSSPPLAQWRSRHVLWLAHKPSLSHTEPEQSSVEQNPDSLSGIGKQKFCRLRQSSHSSFSSIPWKCASGHEKTLKYYRRHIKSIKLSFCVCFLKTCCKEIHTSRIILKNKNSD